MTTAAPDPLLKASYRACRRINARHGRTYFLATRMLTAAQRPAIHALYGFARRADDIVDDLGSRPTADRAADLDAAGQALFDGIDTGHSADPVLAATIDTITRYRIDRALFASFLTSMRQDLTVTSYATRRELDAYMYGSAEVIGLWLLPILGLSASWHEAAPRAAALGKAFQLTNFLRDVGEDLRRGRVYLPADELAVFGVDRHRLAWCQRTGRPDHRVRQALSDQIARTKAVYRYAAAGISMLHPVSQPCVRTACTLYEEILDRIAGCGYDVFSRRVTVPPARRLSLAATTFTALATTRIRHAVSAQPHPGTARKRTVR